MVQALVTLDENTNRVLNVVKAKYNLRDKGEAIAFLAEEYIDDRADLELKPEFIEKLKKLEKQKTIKVKDFAKEFNL